MATRAAPSDPRLAVAATTTRWFGVGRSAKTDSARAGEQAASGALRGEDSRLVMVFASAAHDLGALLTGI